MKFHTRNLPLLILSGFLAMAAGELYLRCQPPAWLPFLSMIIVQQTHSEPSSNPVLGYIPRAGYSAPFRAHEFRTDVSINDEHMRDNPIEPGKSREGRPRIALLGDSFVFGWGVESRESVSELLESKYFTGADFLNFGISGYCSNQIFEWLRTQAVRFEPDIDLFFIAGNPSTCVPEVQFENGRMYWAWLPRHSPLERLRSFAAHHSYFFGFLLTEIPELRYKLRQFVSGARPADSENPAPDPSQGFDILENLKRLSEEKRFVPVVVHFHDDREVWEGFQPPEQQQFESLKEFCRTRNLLFLDLMQPLRESWKQTGRSPYFRYDPHWNRFGHEIAARAIAEFLKAQKLLPVHPGDRSNRFQKLLK